MQFFLTRPCNSHGNFFLLTFQQVPIGNGYLLKKSGKKNNSLK